MTLIKETKILFKRRRNNLILIKVINDKEKIIIKRIIKLQGLTLNLLLIIIVFKRLRLI